jgi:hypothetical protein
MSTTAPQSSAVKPHDQLVPGDIVIFYDGRHNVWDGEPTEWVRKITRLTQKQIIIELKRKDRPDTVLRFNRETGYIIGNSDLCSSFGRITPATPEDIRRVQAARETYALRCKLGNIKWKELSLEMLRAVDAALTQTAAQKSSAQP